MSESTLSKIQSDVSFSVLFFMINRCHFIASWLHGTASLAFKWQRSAIRMKFFVELDFGRKKAFPRFFLAFYKEPNGAFSQYSTLGYHEVCKDGGGVNRL